MRKHGKGFRGNSSGRLRRFALIAIVIAVFALGATASINLRTGRAKDARVQATDKLMTNKNHPNYIHLAGQQNDAGQIRPPNQEEAQRLAEGIKGMVNRSTEGLKSVKHADGSVTMDLEGHFQNVTLAKKTEGGVATACVDNLEAAAAFLEIDLNLMKNLARPGSTPRKSEAK